MATQTMTKHQRALRSTVAMKAVMAVTGLIMVGFLLMHMYGNFKLFLGQEAFNHYSHYLREFGDPLIPPMWFLWAFRIFMLVAIALHIYSAISLWHRNKKNVGTQRYRNSKFLGGGNYVSFFMRWGGIAIIAFLIFHILQFTAEAVTVGYSGSVEPAMRMINGFQPENWWVFVVYVIAMALVCFHVAHGFWSAFATLGANVSRGAERVLTILAGIIAVLLFIGFLAAPVAILTGVIPA